MLSQKALELSSIIARDLDSKNLRIEVKPNSSLAKVITGVGTPSREEVTSLESYRDIGKAIYHATLSLEHEGKIPYDTTMDSVVGQLAPMLKRYIQVLKEVINPLIRDISTTVRTGLDGLSESTDLNIEVVESPVPDLLVNQQFLSLVDTLKDSIISEKPAPLRPQFPELHESEVRSVIVDYPGLEANIAAFLSEGDIDKQAYDLIFRQLGTKESSLGTVLNHRPDSLQLAIATFLLAIKFLQDPVKGALGTLEEYENGLIQIRGQAALAIANYLDSLKRKANLGIMVMSRNDKKITVNPLNYREWISGGGDVEALYGLTLDNSPYKTISEINENKDNLIHNWTKYRSSVTDSNGIYYVNKAKELLSTAFITKIQDPLYSDVGLPADQAIANYKKLLEFITATDLQDLPTLVMRLVCSAKYPDLNAEQFFKDLDDNISRNSGLNMREAALLATINYLSRWVAEDMILTSASSPANLGVVV